MLIRENSYHVGSRHLRPAASESGSVARVWRAVWSTVLGGAGLLLVGAATSAARAEVVFGNLGASGTGSIGGAGQQLFPTTTNALNPRAMAMGFQTSSGPLDLVSVTLGISMINDATFGNRTVAIRADSSGNPGAVISTSNAINIPGGRVGQLYTFTFPSEVALSPSTTYWVVPSESLNYVWYESSPAGVPVAYANSGISYVGARAKNSSDVWVSSIPSNPVVKPYSLSIVAVPEPVGLALAGIGTTLGALLAWRRWKRYGG